MGLDRQELRDFLFRASHDLRTSLRAVRTNAELLLRSSKQRTGAELDQILHLLVGGTRNAESLVSGLANYALALQVQPNPAPVSAGILVRSALAKLEAEMQENDARVVYGDLPQVTGDSDRLIQLFENLMRNAIQHRGEAPPHIEINAGKQDGEWVFAVRDNGPGIDAEDLERIFRPFQRLRPDRGGAGLGLAICREIVAGHGGRIWAESVMGTGTAIYFTLA
jgi:chemotaxis family two-component system sensor kinase Cph1